MKKNTILLFYLFFLNSCTIQRGNVVYKSEYESLFSYTDKVIFQPNDSIYYITGKTIRDDLKNHPKSMVYIFNPACNSKYCRLLTYYENYADKNGYFLYLVSNTRFKIDNAINQLHTTQLYILDFEHYGNLTSGKTRKLFVKDLISNDKVKTNGSFYFFEKDSFIKTLLNSDI